MQLTFTDIHGDKIYFEEHLKPKECNGKSAEISVSSGRIQFLPWLCYTSILTILSFIAQLHTLHPVWLGIAVIIQLIMFMYRVHHKVIRETLLVVAGLGVQTTITFYTGRQHTRFILWSDVIDIIIAETITMQQVLFYLALLVRAEKSRDNVKLLPLFMNTWPRLACLQQIYSACQEVLFPDKSKLKRKNSICMCICVRGYLGNKI
ncbi:phosphatidylinositol N-acetylglucosaminyltransferase subunit H-like isoform X2 [Macrobrachium rosenbergii]|uniref:phosphatidylinositol N-acetylglucosaminyltransferase subunit H-like isoform X2 n=1 Tax=Macrobrachium rosenbergii TaxID=79674 RepID=UPI0034D7ADB6